MKDLAPALTVLLVLLVLLSAWRALPVLAVLLFPDRLRVSFEDPLSIEAALSGPPQTREWLRRLREMGFLVMGVKVERLPLWGRAVREVALVSKESAAYASVVLHPDGSPANLYFHTPLRDGGMVFTSNSSTGIWSAREGANIQHLPAADLTQVLAAHRERVQALQSAGAVPQVGHTPDARLQATRAFYRQHLRRNAVPLIVRQGALTFVLNLVLLGLVVAWWRLR